MTTVEKKYRVFWHYHKAKNGMTIHFKGQCISVKDLQCTVPVETKWFDEQPRLRMYGYCQEVIVENNKAIIK